MLDRDRRFIDPLIPDHYVKIGPVYINWTDFLLPLLILLSDALGHHIIICAVDQSSFLADLAFVIKFLQI